MNANNSTSISRRFKWVMALSAIATSLLGLTVSAKDEVPTKEALSGYSISATQNPDGSQDILFGVVGVSTHSGRFTGLGRTHVEPANPSQYHLETHSLWIPVHSSGTYTAANGDTHDWAAEGIVIVPLDASFMPLPPPYAFHSTWEIVGGTGRFAGSTGHGTGEGFSYADGTTSEIHTGVVSTVGSNKK